jgi:hypothetical protein
MARRSKARCCNGVGAENKVVVWSRPRRTVLRVRQAKCRSNERKLVTGSPLSVSFVAALRRARRRDRGGSNGGGTSRRGGGAVMVIEQNGGKLAPHMPFEIIGEQA